MLNSKMALVLQSLVESSLIEWKLGRRSKVNVQLQYFPYRCERRLQPDPTLALPTIKGFITFFLVFHSYELVKAIVQEKEKGLLEMLLIYGAKRHVNKWAWVAFGAVMFLIPILPHAILFNLVTRNAFQSTFFLFTQLSFLCFPIAASCFCYFISTICTTSNKVVLWVMFINVVCGWFLPTYADFYNCSNPGNIIITRLVVFIHPFIAIQYFISYILEHEKQRNPVSWSPTGHSMYLPLEVPIIYGLQSILFFTLSWYFERVVTGRYGLKLPFYFIFLPSYWKNKDTTKVDQSVAKALKTKVAAENTASKVGHQEPVPEDKKVVVEIKKLVKAFGSKLACNNLSINFYEDELTALLGHNGAGKSTLMNILAGLVTPTSGTATVNGQNVIRQHSEVHSSFGYCPQFNVIFDALTITEHLWLLGALRGITQKKIETDLEALLAQVNLAYMLNSNDRGISLNESKQRHLSIVISLIGMPKMVILDEPTSQCDPFSRRNIWDLILHCKTACNMLISSHHMEEVDILSDRVAIIDNGTLKCYGSPMYLKTKFGPGFSLILTHSEEVNIGNITEELKAIVPITLQSTSETQTVYNVPLYSARSKLMIQAFKLIENEGEALGISSFGVREATMEQVFVAVNKNSGAQVKETANSVLGYSKQEINKYIGIKLLCMQFIALVHTRLLEAWRNRMDYGVIYIGPPIFFLLLIILGGGSKDSSLTFHLNEEEIQLNYQFMTKNNYNFIIYHKNQANIEMLPFVRSMTLFGFGIASCIKGRGNCSGSSSNEYNITDIVLNKWTTRFDCSKYSGSDTFKSLKFGRTNDSLLLAEPTSDISQLLLSYNEKELIGIIDETEFGKHTVRTLYSGVKSTKSSYDEYEDYRIQYFANSQMHFLNAYYNTEMRTIAMEQKMADVSTYKIVARIKVSDFEGLRVVAQKASAGFFTISLVCFTVIWWSYGAAIMITKERTNEMKALMITFGLNRLIYWLATFFANLLLCSMGCTLLTLVMCIDPMALQMNPVAFFIVTIIGYFNNLFLTCKMSTICDEPMNGIHLQILVAALCIGFTMFMETTGLFQFIQSSNPQLYELTDMFNIVPFYFLCSMSVEVIGHGPSSCWWIFTWDVIGKRLIPLLIWIVGFSIWLIITELEVVKRQKNTKHVSEEDWVDKTAEVLQIKRDEDIINYEKEVINSKESYVLQARGVVQHDDGDEVLRNVTLGVNKKQCLAVLGGPDAGKSDLFKVLSGQNRPSYGEALLNQKPIYMNYKQQSQKLAYCPHNDILFDSLTPKEHFHLFGSFRGIHKSVLTTTIEQLSQKLSLEEHMSKQVWTLSGGNKRKTSFAIAMLTRADVILLEDFSRGVDIIVRQAAINHVKSAIEAGSCAIVAANNFEEAELLADKVIVLSSGRSRFIGAVQHLKCKFGGTYSLKFRIFPSVEVTSIIDRIRARYPKTKVVDKGGTFLELQVPGHELKQSELFSLIHELKSEKVVQEFSVNQASLEQVFVGLTNDLFEGELEKQQQLDDADKKGVTRIF